MRRIPVLALLLVLLPLPARGARVAVNWDAVAPTQAGSEIRYVVFMGTESRPAQIHHPEDEGFRYGRMKSVNKSTRFIVDDLREGERRVLTVIAIDDMGRSSNYSDEMILTLQGGELQIRAGAKAMPSRQESPPDTGGCASIPGAPHPSAWLLGLALLLGISARRAS